MLRRAAKEGIMPFPTYYVQDTSTLQGLFWPTQGIMEEIMMSIFIYNRIKEKYFNFLKYFGKALNKK